MAWGNTDSQAEYELREARSEISRHHKLIADLRESLVWALQVLESRGSPLHRDDHTRFEEAWRLVNRQVG